MLLATVLLIASFISGATAISAIFHEHQIRVAIKARLTNDRA